MSSAPTLAQLRLFVEVADAGSFSEAAAQLGMSQSSLSEAVASLERTLGHRLLRRSRGGVTLTGPGERAIEHARSALLAVSDLELSVCGGLALKATLRIATYRSLGVHLLPSVLARLRGAHPELQIRVLDAEGGGRGGEQMVRSGHADVGLIELPVGEDLISWPLLQDDYLLIAPRRGPALTTWEDLRGAHLILPPASDPCHRRARAHFAAHGVSMAQVSEVEEDGVILKMVEHGLGVAVMPRLAVQPLPSTLTAWSLPTPLIRPLGVAVRVGRAGVPHIHAFIEAVRAVGSASFVGEGHRSRSASQASGWPGRASAGTPLDVEAR